MIAASPAPMAAIWSEARVWLSNDAWRNTVGSESDLVGPDGSPIDPAGPLRSMAPDPFPPSQSLTSRRRSVRGQGGDEIRFDIVATPLRDAASVIDGILLTTIELAIAQDSKARRDALRIEFRHHVGNLLATLRSIVGHGTSSNQTTDEFSIHLSDRIDALGRIQSKVLRDQSASVDLEELLSDQVAAQGGSQGGVTLNGPRVALSPRLAGTLGLAFHELATNALKFGGLSRSTGRLNIEWRIERDAGPVLRLVWRESGVAAIAAAPRNRGFGLTFIEEAIVYELQGDVRHELRPGGLICELVVPFDPQFTAARSAAADDGYAGK